MDYAPTTSLIDIVAATAGAVSIVLFWLCYSKPRGVYKRD